MNELDILWLITKKVESRVNSCDLYELKLKLS